MNTDSSGTTFQKIADELNITKGAITYHFKNKFMIMETFIDDLFSQIKGYVDSFPEEYKNRYWRHCIIYIYAYRKIMSTPKNMELFYHKDQQLIWQNHQAGHDRLESMKRLKRTSTNPMTEKICR